MNNNNISEEEFLFKTPSGKSPNGTPFWYINLNTIDTELTGKKWHRIHTINFGWEDPIRMQKHCKIFNRDILIHKQWINDNILPNKNYFVLFQGDILQYQNKDVKKELVISLLNFINKYKILPYECNMTNSYKNGNVQITYIPSEYDKFALKITPKMCEHFENIPNTNIKEYFSKLDVITKNPLQSKKINKKQIYNDFR